MAACPEHRIRDDGHQADIPAAVNQTKTARAQRAAEAFRHGSVFGRPAVTRPGKHTNFPLASVHFTPRVGARSLEL
jgi:hypothetical protein